MRLRREGRTCIPECLGDATATATATDLVPRVIDPEWSTLVC